MTKKSLEDVFPGATVSATQLTIPASVFTDQGVTLDGSTEPQDIIAALTARQYEVFTTDNRVLNPDETISITKDNPTLVTESGTTRARDVFRVGFYKEGTFDTFNPADY